LVCDFGMDDGANQRGSGLANTFLCTVGAGSGGQRHDDIRIQGFKWSHNYWRDN